MSRALSLGCAAALVVLAVIGCVSTGPTDAEAAWDYEQALSDLRATEPGSNRREAVAQRVCREVPGPPREARWTPDNELVCALRTRTLAAHP